jgi:dipeptidyl aminopeptidase/acylaminoacyl peptidase
VATLSPAVRGSRGYGATFYRLNDGDLGGDEIADLFAAARFLVGQGYPEDHIGVWGRSHGGYASMRALTFPPGTNGHDEVFPFAFGMADAGFSDILTFHATSNIPDWVILEAGDPAYQPDKLRDRSPLSHVDRLRAPLLLIHGENDRRVPVAESRQMAAACEAAAKSCTYLEVPGQGHVVRGLANEQRVWQARMSFLEEVLSSGAHP